MKRSFTKIDRERFTGASASLPERHTFSRAPRMGGWKGTKKANRLSSPKRSA